MKDLILKLRNWHIWKDYHNRAIRGNPVCDFTKGAGYYLETGLIFVNPYVYHTDDEWKMESGKTAIVKLINYKLFHDPDDMVESSEWQFLGYKGEKMIKDMSFAEYVEFAKKNMSYERSK